MLGDNVTAKGLYNIAKEISDYTDQKLLVILEQAEKLARENFEYDIACDVLTLSGKIHRLKGRLYKSLSILNSAFKLHNRKLATDKYRLGQIYRELSVLYGDGFNDWRIAIEYSKKCIQLNIKELNPIFYNNIACDYISIHRYDEAIPFLEKAKILSESISDYYVLCFVYENYSDVFRLTGDFEQSLYYLKLGLNTVPKAYESHSKYQDVVAVNCYILLGLVKTYTAKKEYTEARAYIKKAREFACDKKISNGINST